MVKMNDMKELGFDKETKGTKKDTKKDTLERRYEVNVMNQIATLMYLFRNWKREDEKNGCV